MATIPRVLRFKLSMQNPKVFSCSDEEGGQYGEGLQSQKASKMVDLQIYTELAAIRDKLKV